jgi:hypothetical protein
VISNKRSTTREKINGQLFREQFERSFSKFSKFGKFLVAKYFFRLYFPQGKCILVFPGFKQIWFICILSLFQFIKLSISIRKMHHFDNSWSPDSKVMWLLWLIFKFRFKNIIYSLKKRTSGSMKFDLGVMLKTLGLYN